MTLVERIKLLCEENEETISGLEKELGFGNATIRKWDKATPSGDRLAKVASHFHIPVDFLLGLPPFEHWDYICNHKYEFLNATGISSSDLDVLYSLPTNPELENILTTEKLVNFILHVIKSISFDSDHKIHVTLNTNVYNADLTKELELQKKWETKQHEKIRKLQERYNMDPEFREIFKIICKASDDDIKDIRTYLISKGYDQKYETGIYTKQTDSFSIL